MDDIKTRQQVVDKIKKSTNILITVSKDPSVDALAAALGLTLAVDKLEKHATAVFSGVIPPAISFLQPEKTFENTTDSLRDFIIALDKEKADHLRYKVDGDVVKIFITPYRTTITNDDLQFSQGDFNVELVVALGVDDQEHLDGALDAHGKILHDASVVTITSGEQTSKLGSIDWHDDKASGLSEMVADLTEALKGDKPIIDQQIATAILTGIVAKTDRFSNPHTTSKVMTTAAQLMSAGADQQLVAAKLEESHEINPSQSSDSDQNNLKEDEKTKVDKGGLSIPHETLEDMEKRVGDKDSKKDSAEEGNKVSSAYAVDNVHAASRDDKLASDEPSIGGTLSATTGQAADDARHEKENDQNKTILSHAYLDDSSEPKPTMSGATLPDSQEGHNFDSISQQSSPQPSSAYAFNEQEQESSPASEKPAEKSENDQQQSNAEESKEKEQPASSTETPSSSPTPASVGLPMPPPVPDFSSQPPASVDQTQQPPAAPTPPQQAPPERLGDILAPENNEEKPDESPAQPSSAAPDPNQSSPDVSLSPPAAPSTEPSSGQSDPGQFKLPGQQ